MRISTFAGCALICLSGVSASRAQESNPIPVEPPAALSQPAVAFDAQGTRVIEATLRTTSLNGAPDTPVTNTRIVLKNVSQNFYDFVSGHVTFYDSSNVRCGEGVVKAAAFARGESAESDTPGIRITCSPTSWRLVATHLVPRLPENSSSSSISSAPNFVISIDGEEHPLQLGKPMIVNLANRQRTIVVRAVPQ